MGGGSEFSPSSFLSVTEQLATAQAKVAEL
jgi:hypothetical protein